MTTMDFPRTSESQAPPAIGNAAATGGAGPDDCRRFRLDDTELAALRELATCESYADGQVLFNAGDADIDLFVVECGAIEILNPVDNNRCVATHLAGEFVGDIDLLTRRPVIVTARARGRAGVCRVPGERMRELLLRVPGLSEKLLDAFQARRSTLQAAGLLGLRVVGPGDCRDTTLVREFLYKNFVPFTYIDSNADDGRALMKEWGSPRKSPVIECRTGGPRMLNPPLRDLAREAGIWRECPAGPVDLAVVGAGPAGIAAAVYAASEGLSTIVLDRLGPGGQAGGSSKIENFIGFPSGLSGTDLATRGVLQMLKFGAKIAAPVAVERLDAAPSRHDCHVLHLDCGGHLAARTVLVATGVNWRKLNATNADRFERAGIYYACTSVEATLHDQQHVAVVGAGNSAGQAAMYLAECCRSRTVHLLVRRTLGPSMSEYLVGRLRATPNVKIHEGVEVSAVNGSRRIESVDLRASAMSRKTPDGDGSSAPSAPVETLPVSAVFVFIGADPQVAWLPKEVARDELGYVLTGHEVACAGLWPVTDREPCPLETSVPGVLAAGDLRSGSTKRVGFAVGDGSLAITCVHRLLGIRGER